MHCVKKQSYDVTKLNLNHTKSTVKYCVTNWYGKKYNNVSIGHRCPRFQFK